MLTRPPFMCVLKARWLMAEPAELQLAAADGEGGGGGELVLRRRQEMPKEAFLTPFEAVALLDRGDRSVLVVSHAWQTAGHPDPCGTTLRTLRAYLMSDPAAAECGVFFE